jgi:Tfp pilus assembly protein PilF
MTGVRGVPAEGSGGPGSRLGPVRHSSVAEYRITAACIHLAAGRERSAAAQLAVACEIEPDRPDVAALHAAILARVSRQR